MDKVATRVYFTKETKEYLDKQSEAYGMSVSGYVNMCVAQYRQQTQVLTEMMNLKEYVKDLQQLSDQGVIISNGMLLKAMSK